jgi:hypothetical protein
MASAKVLKMNGKGEVEENMNLVPRSRMVPNLVFHSFPPIRLSDLSWFCPPPLTWERESQHSPMSYRLFFLDGNQGSEGIDKLAEIR